MRNNLLHKQSGLSLVELMVATALSAVLIYGVLTIFVESKKTDKLGAALSTIQETGRFAIKFLTEDLRLAGHHGCRDSLLKGTFATGEVPASYNSVRGWIAAGDWADGTEFDGIIDGVGVAKALANSSVVAIQYAGIDDSGVVESAMANKGADPIVIGVNSLGNQENNLAFISDCEAVNADIFRIDGAPKSVSGKFEIKRSSTGNTFGGTPELSVAYNNTATLRTWHSIAYFVGSTGRVTADGFPVNALYRVVDSFQSASRFDIQELVEGVDFLDVVYGQVSTLANSDGSISYIRADDANFGVDDTAIVSVKIGILVNANLNVRDLGHADTQTYVLPSVNVVKASAAVAGDIPHAEDRSVRREFSAMVNIRNEIDNL